MDFIISLIVGTAIGLTPASKQPVAKIQYTTTRTELPPRANPLLCNNLPTDSHDICDFQGGSTSSQ